MIRKFFVRYKRLASIAALIAMLSFSSVPVASAQLSKQNVCAGVGVVNGASSDCTIPANPDGTPGRTVESTIKKVVDVLSFAVGFISVIMIIIGGLRYILSGGDSGNIEAAKNTILYALVGLFFVALAQIIVNFVIKIVVQ